MIVPRRSAGAVLTVAAVLAATGCASRVPVEPAPSAGEPICASVVLDLPYDLGDLPRLRTTSQASVAWGDPAHPVVLRCGVTSPGPTTDQCVTADDGDVATDWVAVPDGAGDTDTSGGATGWTFTTYGREPAIEVTVPAEIAGTHSTSFLLELGPAIAQIPATRHCQ